MNSETIASTILPITVTKSNIFQKSARKALFTINTAQNEKKSKLL